MNDIRVSNALLSMYGRSGCRLGGLRLSATRLRLLQTQMRPQVAARTHPLVFRGLCGNPHDRKLPSWKCKQAVQSDNNRGCQFLYASAAKASLPNGLCERRLHLCTHYCLSAWRCCIKDKSICRIADLLDFFIRGFQHLFILFILWLLSISMWNYLLMRVMGNY